MPATFLWFLFDWRGRVGRDAYRITFLILALFAVSMRYLPVRAPALLIALAAVQLLLTMTLDAKRLHDIGASAFWVVATNAGAAGAIGFLFVVAPGWSEALTGAVAQAIDPTAASHQAFIVAILGVSIGAALRSPVLWRVPSRASGARYDHDPRAKRAAVDDGDVAIAAGAEAAIAQALTERRAQEAAAALRRAAPAALSAAGPQRKAFGRRGA